MKVPPGLKEYETGMKNSKDELDRLKKGIKLIVRTLSANIKNIEKIKELMHLWIDDAAVKCFTGLEIATLIHWHYMTGNTVVVRSDASYVKVEDLIDMDSAEVDPFRLLSIQKMGEVFGDEYKNSMEIKSVQVPPSLKEYETSVKNSKNELNRLKLGTKLIEESFNKGDIIRTKKLMDHWIKVAEKCFTELEIATLVHQLYLTGNSVVVSDDGSYLKVEDLKDTNSAEVDPWTLLSVQKMHEVFGEDYKNFMEIEFKENPLN